MLTNLDEKKTKRILSFLSSSSTGFIVVEVSEIPLRNELIEQIKKEIDNVKIVNVDKESKYINLARLCDEETIIFNNFLCSFNENVVDCCTEINIKRDFFISLKKTVVFLLEPCVVDYLIQNCMSFWSCVTLHENLNTVSFNPFPFKYFLLKKDPFFSDIEDVDRFTQENFCEKIHCKRRCRKFNCNKCFEYVSQNEKFDINTWIKNCVALGDYYFNRNSFLEALEYYECVSEIQKRSMPNSSSLYFQLRIAQTFYKSKQFEKTTEILNELLKSEKRILSQGMIANDLGVILFEQNNFKESYMSFKFAQSLFEDYDSEDVRTFLKTIYYNISLYYYKTNNNRCSSDYSRKMKSVSYATPYDFEFVSYDWFIRIKYGEVCHKTVEVFPNFTSYDKALYSYVEAFFHFSNGSMGKTIKCLNTSLSICKCMKYKKEEIKMLIANTYHLKGTALFYLNDFSNSKHNLKKAYSYFVDLYDSTTASKIEKTINYISQKHI